jgi:hypothetical protein
MSRATPWAVLLCKFKDDKLGFVTVNRQDVEAMFTGDDPENLVAFWRDVSYGDLDLSGSKVFGWLTLEQKQQDYLSSGTMAEGRAALVDWAKKAATDAGIDLSPFFGVTVYMSTQTDLWGSPGTVVCDTQSNLSQILQEYGHGYGLRHSRSVAQPEDYKDPFCVMSGLDFGGTNPTFAGRFGTSGPLLCAPYVDAAGWMPPARITRVATDGTRPALTRVRLSPLGEMTPPYPQAAAFGLSAPFPVTYFIEYRSGGWDRGLAQSEVVIHQLRPDGYAYYAGSIPASVGFAGGVTLLPGKSWSDGQFDLSVRIAAVWDQADRAVDITVGPAAAVQPLCVRSIARSALNVTGPVSVRTQVMQPSEPCLRASLIELVSR